MKRLLLILCTLAATALRADNPLDDVKMSGTDNQVVSGAVLTVMSGGNVTIASGGTFTYATGAIFAGNASEFRTDIGLGSIATQAASAVAITGGTITGITDLAVADGGTGASTAANARTNLGVVIGTNVQAWDADLDTWATKTPYAGNVVVTTGKSITVSNTLTLTATDGSTLNIGAGGTLGTAAYTASTAYATAAQGTLADNAVPSTRTLSTTAPLTIGGGSSADLSANRTLAISAATTTTAGVVPGIGGTDPANASTVAQVTAAAEGLFAVETQALLYADLDHDEGTAAFVTNDATAANNGLYRKVGATGTGSWVQSDDRVSGLEQRVSTIEISDFLTPPAEMVVDVNPLDKYPAANGGFPGFSNFPAELTFSNRNEPVTVDGYVTRFTTVLNNAESGRVVRFYVLRLVTGTTYSVIYDSGDVAAEAAMENTFDPAFGAVAVETGDLIGVYVNYVSSSNSIRYYDSGGPNIETPTGLSYGGAASGDTVFSAEPNTRWFPVTANVVPRDIYMSTQWGNKAGGYVRISSDGFVAPSIAREVDSAWTGKRIMWLGTSITAGASATDLYGFADRVADRLGAINLNQAQGGSGVVWDGTREISLAGTIAEITAVFGAPAGNAYSYENVMLGHTPDLVIFDHGYNDRNLTLGTISDTSKATFYGAMNFLIGQLYAENPAVRIGMLTPPYIPGTGYGAGYSTETQAIRDAIKALGEKYKIPVLDVTAALGINDATAATLLDPDDIHLTTATHERMSHLVAQWIKSL